MKEFESLMRSLRNQRKQQQFENRMNRIQRILSSEQYMVEVFFHPQTAKRLEMKADFCEVYGIETVRNLFDLRCKHNAGISKLKVYANGKCFRTINFSGNEIETKQYSTVNLF